MAEKLNILLELQGADQVKTQLDGIGQAGSKAFEDIQKSAANTNIENIKKPIDEATKSVTELGAAAQQTGQSFSALQNIAAATQIASFTGEVAKLAVEFGAAVLVINKVRTPLTSLKEGFSAASLSLRAFAAALPGVAVVGTSFAGIGLAVGQVALALKALEVAATAFAASDAKLSASLKQLAEDTGQTTEALQQGQAVFGQLGVGADTFAEAARKINESMSGLDVGAKIKEQAQTFLEATAKILEAQIAIAKSGGAGAALGTEKRLEEINAQLQGLTAQKALTDAVAARTKLLANDLGKVTGLVDQIASGWNDIHFDSLTTADTKFNALVAVLKQANDEFGNANEVLLKFLANADKATAIQLGKKLGLSTDDINKIRLLGGELSSLDQIFRRVQAAGVPISPEAARSFQEMDDAIVRNQASWARLQQAWKSTVFTEVAAQISSSLRNLETRIISFVASAIEKFNTLFAAIQKGAAAVGKTEFFQAFSRQVDAANVAIANLFGKLATEAGIAPSIIKAVQDSILGVTTAAGTATQALGNMGNAGANAGLSTARQMKIISIEANATGQVIATTINGIRQLGETAGQSGIRASGGIKVINNEFFKTGQTATDTGTKTATAIQTITTATNQAKTAGVDFTGMMTGIDFQSVATQGTAAWNAITGAINGAVTAARTFAGISPVSPPGEPGPTVPEGSGGLAGGGLIGGRGTGTSDSNLAWVSRGEHVMPARAVRQPGVLAFLEMLRAAGGDLQRVMDRMGRFALGGLVTPRALPAFAEGGLVGHSAVTIQFPGMPPITGLRASSDTVSELRRAAAMAQVRSGGRKPSRYS